MPKKPSSMKRTGKAKAKPSAKKKNGSKYLGTGAAGKGRDALKKAAARRKKALKEYG